MLYFAYGSNMSTPRLKGRVPSAYAVGTARLGQHKLRFHKRSKKDGSAKCDAEFTDRQEDFVWGVLYEINDNEKPKLDRLEGLGNGYDKKFVSVTDMEGKERKAITYYATDIDKSLKPYDWYKEHVIRGAKEHGLPEKYIVECIVAIEALQDTNEKRRQDELSIYSDKN